MMTRLYAANIAYIVCFLSYLMYGYDNPYSFLSGNDVMSLADKIAWCMLFFPVWGLGLWLYSENWKQADIVVYRYYSILKWWNRLGMRLILFILSSYLLLCVGIGFLFSTDLSYDKIRILGWLIVHALGLILIVLWLGLFIRDIVYVGAVLILMEIGVGADIQAANGQGFMIPVEIMLFVGLFFLFCNSRKGLLRRKLAYEKND